MKKLRFLTLIATVMITKAFTANASTIVGGTQSETDTVSYLIGSVYGQGLREQVSQFPGHKISIDDLINGFVKAAQGDSIFLGKELLEAQIYINDFLEEYESRMEQEHRTEVEKFMAENKVKPGVTTTESGLQYKVEKAGTGTKPMEGDTVIFHYQGSLIDGTVFDSTFEYGEPIKLAVNGLIQGMTEGLQLMQVGSKYTFWMPIELGYYNMPGTALTNKFLIFEVELIEIVKE